MRRWLVAFTLAVGFLLGQVSARGAAAPQIVDPHVEYTFGGQILFRAGVQSDTALQSARLYFRRPEDSVPVSIDLDVSLPGELIYAYETVRYPLRAFSKLSYWFEIVDQGGNRAQTDPLTFAYEDNRFNWQTLQDGLVRVHWYDDDANFGKELLAVTQKGMEQAQNWLPLSMANELNIYAYANASEMQSTMRLAGVNWAAGHADPDLRVAVVALPKGPEQRVQMERRIPHELMHILLYETVGPVYRSLPVWFVEGLASINELYPEPNYHTILTKAAENNGLLPMSSLCANFPVDAAGAYLAYAQAASFTRYIFDQYGPGGLQALLGDYAANPDCQAGMTAALGVSLTDLEQAWQKSTFTQAIEKKKTAELWPWLVVLGVILVTPLILAFVGRKPRQGKVLAPARR